VRPILDAVKRLFFLISSFQLDECDTGCDRIRSDPIIRRNPGEGITYRSDGRIIITTHLISIHLISTMGFNFTRLLDSIGYDCRVRSDSSTRNPDVILFPRSHEFHRILTELQSVPYRIR